MTLAERAQRAATWLFWQNKLIGATEPNSSHRKLGEWILFDDQMKEHVYHTHQQVIDLAKREGWDG